MKKLILVYLLVAAIMPIQARATTSQTQTTATTAAADTETAAFTNLRWRSIGPANMGGRVTDIAGIPGDPYTFYIGAADGGIFKTTNGGTTFKPLFQDQAVLSI